MSKSMIPDFVALVVNAMYDSSELVRLDADDEKCGLRMLALEHIENLRSPLWIRSVIECNCDLVGAVAVTSDAVGLRQRLKVFVGDDAGIRIDGEVANPWRGTVFN